MIGSSLFRLWEPNHGLAFHIQAVNDVRIQLERDKRLGTWECERSIARRMTNNRAEGARGHLPDGILDTNAGPIAIEVELTLKSRVRLGRIVDALTKDYHEVWYFAPKQLERALNEIKSHAPRQNIQIHRYHPGD